MLTTGYYDSICNVILEGSVRKHCSVWLIMRVTAKNAGIAARLLKKCELVDSVMLPFL